ncbi:MAG: protein kinase [Gemmatimonadaceae bacterium]
MDVIQQLARALEGRYTIEREIGRGGMATVYLAHDVKHDRQVALKVLDPELGAVLGVERFLSEIRVTARLQHPNLLPLFDSGEANGLLFYVMPFVEGETLRAKLDREKQLPVDEAVRMTVAIANALDYAHGHGVIHRDLKPENILIQHGQPVVADFGIALAVSRAGGARVTQTGLSLGTPMYMSPEQATGDRVIDGRTDIYSLGAVAYEMLAGEPPHTGTSAQAIISKLMTEEPRNLTAVRRTVPDRVDFAIHRALEKLPADRWPTGKAFADALTGTGPPSAAGVRSRNAAVAASRTPWIVAVVAVVVAAAALITAVVRRPSEAPGVTLRFDLVVPDTERSLTVPGIPFDVSADDRQIVYVGQAGAGQRLYTYDLQTGVTKPIIGSEGGFQPVFSPDGKSIVFVNGDNLVRVQTDGGSQTRVIGLDKQSDAGMSWVDPDTIIASLGGQLVAIPTNGGPTVTLSRPDVAHHEKMQWGPHDVLGRFIAYVAVSPEGVAAHRLGILDRKTKVAMLTSNLAVTVLGAIDDRVLWITASGMVMGARIDHSTGALGQPRPIPVDNVNVGPSGAGKAVLSRGGSLLYRRGRTVNDLVIVDARGAATPLGAEALAYRHPRWSPDGSKVAAVVVTSDGEDVVIIDTRTKAMSKLTSGTGINDAVAWTPDGKRVAYRAESDGGSIKWVAVDGTDRPSTLLPASRSAVGVEFSQDMKWLLYRTTTATSIRRDLLYLPANGEGEARVIEAGGGGIYRLAPDLSPDDHWVAYTSDESGRNEIYVRPFPGPGARVQISAGGGDEAKWSRDGKSLYYRAGRDLYEATLGFAGGVTVAARQLRFTSSYVTDQTMRDYDLSPDGKSFLMLRNADTQVETTVVYGWANEVRRAWP